MTVKRRWKPALLVTVAAPAFQLLVACSENAGSMPPTNQVVLTPTPFMDIAVTGQTLRWATRMDDGRVAVADQYGAALIFYDSTGTQLRVVGRSGDGPGEFGNPMWIDGCGTDSLFTWDASRRVMVVLDSEGSFVREFRPELDPYEVSCSRSGWIGVLGMPIEYVPPSDDGTKTISPLGAVDREGRVIVRLPDVPLGENRALGLLTRIAAGESELYVGTADSAWVHRYALDGTQGTGLEVGLAGRRPTHEQFESAIEEMVGITPIRELRDRQRQVYANLDLPDQLPAYRELRTDPLGLIWAVVSAPGDTTTELRAAAADGGYAFRGALPQPLRVFEVGADYLLAGTVDESGTDRVLAYRITRN